MEAKTGEAIDGRGTRKSKRESITVETERKISARLHGKERAERGRVVSATDHVVLLLAPPLQGWKSSGGDVEPGQRGGRSRREQTQSEFLAAPGDNDSFR